MSLSSVGFLLFVLVGVIIYYSLGRSQWQILLVMSCVFYISYGIKNIPYVLVTIVSTYVAAILIEEQSGKSKKAILICALLINFGMLATVKYTSLLSPVGISFYTFQITGYVLDVYWKRDQVEHNFCKHAIFTLYFPQIIQGPISKHNELGQELFREHKFAKENIQDGLLLISWGMFKKLVIADTLTGAVTNAFDLDTYYGIDVVLGIILYGIQLYCDFSGGIDLIKGVSLLFDIKLTDNFRQPFFSKSISEFWRRWHISLGRWMKDYVFYPLSLSKNMAKIGKSAKKIFGKNIGRKIPICISNIVVFLIVGIWHGSSANFVLYGLYNGIIIATSTLLEGTLIKKPQINNNFNLSNILRVVRTLILINIGWIFDRCSSVAQMGDVVRRIFTSSGVNNFGLGLQKYQMIYVSFGLILVLTVSILKERGNSVLEIYRRQNVLVRTAILTFIICIAPLIGYYDYGNNSLGGFMYAVF